MKEGTPSTLQRLVRKDEPSHTEWNDILEHLRLRINPFLDTVTLNQIAGLRLPGSKVGGKFDHIIVEDLKALAVSDEKTREIVISRGFFFLGKETKIEGDQTCFRIGLWGLDRNGRWRFGYIKAKWKEGLIGYLQALSIELSDSSPDSIVASGFFSNDSNEPYYYQDIWLELKKAFDFIVRDRREKYIKVKRLQTALQKEDQLIREILQKIRS